MYIEERKEHFDPDTLKPFDKVLVRCEWDEKWVPQFFGRWAYAKRYTKYALCVGDEKGLALETPEGMYK